jgi:hypothetical protein
VPRVDRFAAALEGRWRLSRAGSIRMALFGE